MSILDSLVLQSGTVLDCEPLSSLGIGDEDYDASDYENASQTHSTPPAPEKEWGSVGSNKSYSAKIAGLKRRMQSNQDGPTATLTVAPTLALHPNPRTNARRPRPASSWAGRGYGARRRAAALSKTT